MGIQVIRRICADEFDRRVSGQTDFARENKATIPVSLFNRFGFFVHGTDPDSV